MQLPIKIEGNNVLIENIEILDEKFCYLLLSDTTIIKKSYCRCQYKHESGIIHSEDVYHIEEDILLSKHLIGVEMATHIRDYDMETPFFLKIILSFVNGLQMYICFNDN
jgi:hypothetical protein